jgi:hypothetical protein
MRVLAVPGQLPFLFFARAPLRKDLTRRHRGTEEEDKFFLSVSLRLGVGKFLVFGFMAYAVKIYFLGELI